MTLPGRFQSETVETVKQFNKLVKAKLQLLKFTNAQTSDAVEKEDNASAERLRNTLAKKAGEVHELKVRVQELRFEVGHEEGEILIQS